MFWSVIVFGIVFRLVINLGLLFVYLNQLFCSAILIVDHPNQSCARLVLHFILFFQLLFGLYLQYLSLDSLFSHPYVIFYLIASIISHSNSVSKQQAIQYCPIY